MTTPVVAAVVVAYNSADDLEQGLPTLAARDIELIVVDNASTDGSGDVARSAGARVIAAESNRGWAVGCNVGAAAASAPVLAFVNPDARPSADDLRRLAGHLQAADVGLVAPRFVNPDGSGQPFYFRFPGAWSGIFCFFGSASRLDRLFGRPFIGRRTYSFGAELPCEVDQPGAACVLVRADVFHELGGFDEQFFLFFADTDLCLRMSQRGLRVVVDWDLDVAHRGGGSVRRINDITRQHHGHRDYLVYARRHYGRAGRFLSVCAYVVLGGLVPALSRLLHGRAGDAGRHLTLMWAGLSRDRSGTPA